MREDGMLIPSSGSIFPGDVSTGVELMVGTGRTAQRWKIVSWAIMGHHGHPRPQSLSSSITRCISALFELDPPHKCRWSGGAEKPKEKNARNDRRIHVTDCSCRCKTLPPAAPMVHQKSSRCTWRAIICISRMQPMPRLSRWKVGDGP